MALLSFPCWILIQNDITMYPSELSVSAVYSRQARNQFKNFGETPTELVFQNKVMVIMRWFQRSGKNTNLTLMMLGCALKTNVPKANQFYIKNKQQLLIWGPKFEFRESWIYCYLRSIILHYFSPGFHFKSFLKAQHKSIMQTNLEPSLGYSNSFHLDIVFMSSKPLQ